RRLLPPGLHHVDLPGGGPRPVLLVLREHPQGGPDAPAGRQLRPELEPAVGLAEQRGAVLLSGLEPRRRVPAAVDRLLERPDVDPPVPDKGVARLPGVVLEFVVAPAGDPLVGVVTVEAVADVEIPF